MCAHREWRRQWETKGEIEDEISGSPSGRRYWQFVKGAITFRQPVGGSQLLRERAKPASCTIT